MSAEPTGYPRSPGRINPWLFVPLLYFMQAIPVTLVQEVSTIAYMDFGAEPRDIVQWVSLLSLPWSLQLLLGPLVDLTATKRRWVLGAQLVIAVGLIAWAYLVSVPDLFGFSLLVLGVTAVTSALCNIATDGLYLLTLPKDDQARFVGIQSTFYRLGRLATAGLLVWAVGTLSRLPNAEIPLEPGTVVQASLRQIPAEKLLVQPGGVIIAPTEPVVSTEDKEIRIDPKADRVYLASDGTVTVRTSQGETVAGRVAVVQGGVVPTVVESRMNQRTAWMIGLFGMAILYLAGRFVNGLTIPRPPADVPRAAEGETAGGTLLRTGAVLGFALSAYFLGNALVRIAADFLAGPLNLPGWQLPSANLVLGWNPGLSSHAVEAVQLAVCLVLAGALSGTIRSNLRGTQMGEAFASFVRQPGFPAILFFVLFYRLGEAMLGRMTPIFLKDSVANGGLGLLNDQLGLIKGIAGVIGIVLGGIVGGWVISRIGLKRAFWFLAGAMYLPNFLYLWFSLQPPPLPLLYVSEFADQFGYGFGFAGYMVYLMWVAQRGNYQTSHFAIGTGMGALCIAFSGVLSGVIQANFGYPAFFVTVMLVSIPGLIAIRLIPLDDSHRQLRAEVD